MTATDHAAPPAEAAPDPLAMAMNCARNVLAYAEAQDADPLLSYTHKLGDRGHQAAQLGACMAAVSAAADARRSALALEKIADRLGDIASQMRGSSL